MPNARPVRALVWAIISSVLVLVLSLCIPSVAQAYPTEPETGELTVSSDLNDLEAAALARAEILFYRIKSGDTLWDIAAAFDIDVDTIRWSNPAVARNPDAVPLGTELVILPVKGAYVTVEAGDSLERLATRWGVAPEDITSYLPNGLSAGQEPRPGARLVIPHGRLEVNLAPPGPPPPGFAYAWPIRGTVTQGYHAGHRAIDFGAPYGAKVYAARAGRVVHRAWSSEGYGFLVIVNHGDGSQTYYSHLKGAWANVGDWLPLGGLVGEVGSTGNSTGPHVHFEIRIGGVPQNPLSLLPPRP